MLNWCCFGQSFLTHGEKKSTSFFLCLQSSLLACNISWRKEMTLLLLQCVSLGTTEKDLPAPRAQPTLSSPLQETRSALRAAEDLRARALELPHPLIVVRSLSDLSDRNTRHWVSKYLIELPNAFVSHDSNTIQPTNGHKKCPRLTKPVSTFQSQKIFPNPKLVRSENRFLGPCSHRTCKQICVQICMQTLWCCLQPVWTLPFAAVCPIICLRLLQGAPRPVWMGPCTAAEKILFHNEVCIVECGVGHQNDVNTGGCTRCPTGTYQSGTNQTSCIQCPLLQTTKLDGAASADLCGQYLLPSNAGILLRSWNSSVGYHRDCRFKDFKLRGENFEQQNVAFHTSI